MFFLLVLTQIFPTTSAKHHKKKDNYEIRLLSSYILKLKTYVPYCRIPIKNFTLLTYSGSLLECTF